MIYFQVNIYNAVFMWSLSIF